VPIRRQCLLADIRDLFDGMGGTGVRVGREDEQQGRVTLAARPLLMEGGPGWTRTCLLAARGFAFRYVMTSS
jgi:hypothetical protein